MNKPECVIDQFGTKHWLLNSKLHREDGPAIEYPNGDKYWWLNGKNFDSEEEMIIYLVHNS